MTCIRIWLLSSILCTLSSVSAYASPQVKFETTQGNFIVELNEVKAPITVKNFLHYVETGGYNGTIFHRVIPQFMVQGGGFDQSMNQMKSDAPINNEASNGLKNLTATIAMARTQDPNSATRQFFINLVDNPFLDYAQQPPGYAVFGRVISGFDVIKAIGQVPTANQGYMQNVPVQPVIIRKAMLLKKSATTASTQQALIQHQTTKPATQ